MVRVAGRRVGGQRGSGRAAVRAEALRVAGGCLVVIDEVQLLTEVVEGEAHHIQEVSVDVLYQHAAQGLDPVAARLVPKRQRGQR